MFELNGQWNKLLSDELNSEYFKKLVETLKSEYAARTVFPPQADVFRALSTVDFPAVKVCILGQDPYHGQGQANGMAFAVHDGNRFPPSLVNIFGELKNDLSVPIPASGTLEGWAKQGVLLLNTTLTVREGAPQSHLGLGWEQFTDAIIAKLSAREQPLVFILWGANAIAKAKLIKPHHFLISSPHPSPLSAYRGFFGSKPFSRANKFLTDAGLTPIDWADVSGNRAEYYNNSDNIKII